jgi:AcrR family transcriptional regulator
MSRSRDEGMRSRIIEAAVAIFREKGYQATTLKDIAAGAGISTGSVYTYFEDKAALVKDAATYGWDRFNADLEVLARSGLAFDARLEALLGSGLEALSQALPFLCGLFFDSTTYRLIQPGLVQAIDSIERLLDPDFSDDRVEDAAQARKDRRSLIEIFVMGIIFSAALEEATAPEENIGNLRRAMLTLFDVLESFKEPERREETTTAGGGEG